MKKEIDALGRMSKWYGMGIIILYCIFVAEYGNSILKQLPMHGLFDNKFFVPYQ